MAHERRVDRGDLQAAAAEVADHPLVAQQQQRLLDGLAGDGEPLGEMLLAQRRPGREPAGADVVDDRVVDLLHA